MAASGDCTVLLASADLASLTAGDYEAEVEVTQSNGTRQTVFDPLSLEILRDDFPDNVNRDKGKRIS